VDRLDSLHRFVKHCFPGGLPVITPASADASFRRYFRLTFDTGTPTCIVMDAPPDKEDCRPFIHAAELLGVAGVNVPRVIAADLEHGFLLLTDLGSQTYLAALRADPGQAEGLYSDAIAALVGMQRGADASVLPPYDRAMLLRELALLPEWYVARHHRFALSDKQRTDLDAAFEALIASNLAQPTVFVHRDYHSRNLMVCPPESGHGANPGVLDFQDAVRGPITYDLVSLLKDAYIEWEEERVLEWTIRYWESARGAGLPVREFGEFYRDFEWMGLQRHLKILGIFARLYHRDGKGQYLADLPLVLSHTRKACARYMAFTPLLRLIDAIEKVEQPGGITF
jgi:aminoglycoside/choline kinase family phosphotransferase